MHGRLCHSQQEQTGCGPSSPGASTQFRELAKRDLEYVHPDCQTGHVNWDWTRARRQLGIQLLYLHGVHEIEHLNVNVCLTLLLGFMHKEMSNFT